MPLNDQEKADVVAYLDGELDRKRASELEARLLRDPDARAEVEALRKTWELLDLLPQPQPTPTFTSRTLERLAVLKPANSKPVPTPVPEAPRRPWAFPLAWAAAVLLAALTGYFGVQSWQTRARSRTPGAAELDQQLIRDLRIVENLRLYEHGDDLDFLKALDDPDLFGDDS